MRTREAVRHGGSATRRPRAAGRRTAGRLATPRTAGGRPPSRSRSGAFEQRMTEARQRSRSDPHHGELPRRAGRPRSEGAPARRGRSIHARPQEEEAVGNEIACGRRVCKAFAARADARISSEMRAHVRRRRRRNFVYNCPSNGAISHRRRVARARARRHPRRHSRRASRSTSTRSRGTCAAARAATAAAAAWRSSRIAREILSGVRAGETIGGPIAMMIENRDWPNWQYTMHVGDRGAGRRRRRAARRRSRGRAPATPTSPASPSTAAATCATSSSAPARAKPPRASPPARSPGSCSPTPASTSPATSSRSATSRCPPSTVVTFDARRGAAGRRAAALRRCRHRAADDRRHRSRAKEAGDTLGGAFEVIATGVPVGLGSYVQWDRKLDGRLAQALMSIPAIKAVGIGLGPEVAAPAGLARPRRDRARRAGRAR